MPKERPPATSADLMEELSDPASWKSVVPEKIDRGLREEYVNLKMGTDSRTRVTPTCTTVGLGTK